MNGHSALPPPAEAALAAALGRAQELRGAGRAEEALALLLPRLAALPHHPGLLHEVAMGHWMLRAHAAAREAFDRFLALRPGHRGALLFRLHMAFVSEDLPAALARAEQTIALLPDDPAPRVVLARLLHRAGRPEAARDMLLAFGADPAGNPELALQLARAHHAVGEHAAGLAVLEQVLAGDPACVEAIFIGLHCAIWQGDAQAQRRFAVRAAACLAGRAPAPAGGGGAGLADALARLLCHMGERSAEPEWRGWLDLVCAAAGEVAPPVLLCLYRMAGMQGLGSQASALLDALLTRRDLGLAAARDILLSVHALDAAAAEAWARHLREAVVEAERPGFDLAAAALRDGAGPALRLRQRTPPRPPEEVLWINALLLEAGLRRLALRYLRRAVRSYPAHAALRRRWLLDLVAAGEEAAAREALRHLLASDALPPAEARRIAVPVLVALDEAEAAVGMLDRLPAGRREAGMVEVGFTALIRLGRFDEARDLLLQAPAPLASRQVLHRHASLNGLRLIEHQMEGMGDATAGAAQFLGAAIREVDAWVAEPAAASASPSPPQDRMPWHIMQYWDTGHPPAGLRPLIESWRGAPGFEHHLFDRNSAQHFLRAHLGPEWSRALRLARHPAEESDFFRLCFLLVRGGIYADCDDRLIMPLAPLVQGRTGLVVFREPGGVIANNFLMATPHHPVLAQAAVAARQALVRRDHDSPWSKTGPGLLTRMVAAGLRAASGEAGAAPISILPRRIALRHVQFHVPLAYKRTPAYWNAASGPATPAGLAQALRELSATGRADLAPPRRRRPLSPGLPGGPASRQVP
ncbi:MAG TPA: glycosyltransferase [Roseococcus sp.]|jgi:tetratricopeptide (TPR) repeat protein|nr:glycosyltransferase [Roseococcus sp.]